MMIEDDPQMAEGRNFDDLDAHGVQEALRDELISDDGDIMQQDQEEEASPTSELEDEEGEGADNSEGGVSDGEDDVWTANQMAEHVRMAEALLFAAVEPLDKKSIADRLPEGADISAIMELVQAQYENRGVNLSKIEKKWRFVTAPDVAHILQKERVEQRKLSRAALETLAIIAYHQPCTRADIEDVRGVAVSRGSLDQLMEIGWVRLRGRRKDVPGRPVLYGTSQDFLEHFSLAGLGDLPGMADLKAAGLLEARLPPDFQVPTPRDSEDEEDFDDEDEAEFSQDFLDEDTDSDASEASNDEDEDADLEDEELVDFGFGTHDLEEAEES